jgi:glycine oxidase
MPAPGSDVIVIGGGVIGLAVARAASRAGMAVTLLERDALGGGASAMAAGMLAPTSEAEFGEAGLRLLRLGLASAERWPAFAAELEEATGVALGLRRTGSLLVARDRDEAEALERELRFLEEQGLDARRLRGSQARELEPALAPGVRLALEVPGDNSVDPRRVCAALARAAGADGVQLRAGAPVARLRHEEERVAGVVLESGEWLRAEQVVLAAGAWSARVHPARVRPVKGQILRLRDPAGPGLLERVVRYEGGYLVPRDDGRYVLGATVEERGFHFENTAGAMRELLREAWELVPGIDELEIEEFGAGVRPGTPDNVPAVGRGAVEGLVWACGHYRNGILLAPLTAELAVGALRGEPPGELGACCDPARVETAEALA